MNQEVLTTVAGAEITNADVDAFIRNLPQEQQMYAANPQFRKQVLDQLVAFRLYSKYAEELKLDETEEFQKIISNARMEILAQMAMGEILKSITVTEEEAKAFYDANPAQFAQGETVSAKHILVKEEAECSDILEAVVNGSKTFEEAAKEFSTCPSGAKGGDLGTFGKGQMVKEFEDAAFHAEIGHVVGPVQTQFGYHLIKVEAKNEASVVPFEEAADQIRRSLLGQKQNQAYMDKVNELKEKYA